MAKSPSRPGTPEPQNSTPQDLYLTSDIRFVMVELGKLTTKVDRLVQDVDRHGDNLVGLGEKIETKIDALGSKVDDLSGKAAFFKGAWWALAGAFAVALVLIPIGCSAGLTIGMSAPPAPVASQP